MAISPIKQIKRILKDHDVRDPRGALNAIEQVIELAQHSKQSKPKPVASIRVFDNPVSEKPLKSVVVIDYDDKRIEPRHLIASIRLSRELGDNLFGNPGKKCDDPNCPVHGKGATNLAELFKKFEEAAIAEAKKGKL